jgi:hypothetical protein
VAGCCEHAKKPFGFVKGGEFLDYLSDSVPLKDSAPWS